MSGCLAVWLSGGSVGWLAGWLLDWLRGCVVRWLANHLTDQPTNGPSWLRKPSNWKPQSFQNPCKEAPWRGLAGSLGRVLKALGRVLGPLRRVLGGSWPQDGSKSQKCSKLLTLVSPIWGHVGAQNQSKSVSRAIQKVIIFLIIFWIDFWSELVPTWPQLGSQSGPAKNT